MSDTSDTSDLSGGGDTSDGDPAASAIDRLAARVERLSLSSVPPAVVGHAQTVVRDTLGVVLAGSTQPENAALAANAHAVGGRGGATVVGSQVRCVPHIAAFVNSTAGVTLELDEGNQYAVNHPAVHVLPAALAVAEDLGRSGAAFLEAFLAGYETTVRLGAAVRLRDGVHPFGTTAVVGVAAATAKLHGVDRSEIAATMRLAAGTAIASSQSAANAGATVRNVCTGLTAHNGVLAVALRAAGHTGEPGAVEAVFGHVLGTRYDPASIVAANDDFMITRNYFKMHACSRWNHAPIEAAAELVRREPFLAVDVEHITVWTYDPAVRLAGQDPANGYAAKHSIPFNVAARIVLGTNGLDAYTDAAVANPEVRSLARRVEVREDPRLTARLPDVRAARLEVALADGRRLEMQVDRPPGGFDNPYDDGVLAGKFRSLAGRALTAGAVDALARALRDLPDLHDLEPLTGLLRSGR